MILCIKCFWYTQRKMNVLPFLLLYAGRFQWIIATAYNANLKNACPLISFEPNSNTDRVLARGLKKIVFITCAWAVSFQLFHQWPFHSICMQSQLSYSDLDAPHVVQSVLFFFIAFCHMQKLVGLHSTCCIQLEPCSTLFHATFE